jgi:hypothetical protein
MKKKLLALSVLAAISSQANAFQFDTGDDWAIRWDNTFKANAVARVNKARNELTEPTTATRGLSWFLNDDADLSVDRTAGGLVSTRIDVISEMDVIWKDNFGFRVSGSGWYDPQYKNSNNDHPSDRRQSWGSPSADVGDYNHEAEDLHYAGGELLDAFAFANFDIGEQAIGVRAGRHTIYWGNGLLTNGAIHGFGGAMAPLDFNKALAVPGSEAKEVFMPTGKVSSVWQITDTLTLNGYYSWEHQAYRLPEAGTFWGIEGLSQDSEFITLAPADTGAFPVPGIRAGMKARGFREDTGDFGFNLQYFYEPWALEMSFIYINMTDMNLHGAFGVVGSANTPAPEFDKGVFYLGEAAFVFKNDINVFGVSLAKEIAGISVGVDLVARTDTALPPEFGPSLSQTSADPNFFNKMDSDDYPGPEGDTYHVIVNGLGFLNGDWGLWDGGTYIVEAVFFMLDSCNKNCELLDVRVNEDRVVSSVAAVFRPTWYQVRAGWDLSLPMSIGYTIDGEKAPISFGGDEEGGSASIGVSVDINQLWKITGAYNARFGPVKAGLGGLYKDRDNVSLTVKRTW